MPANPMPTTDAENRAPFFNRRRTTIAVAAIVIVAGVVITIASVAHAGRVDAHKAANSAPASSASATASATPAASTPAVPALPGPSSIPAPTSPSASRGAPAPITASAEIVPNLVASIANIEAIRGVASTPGEVAGPALRFNVQIRNTTSAPADLSRTIITVYYGQDKTPAIQLEKPGGVPFPATVAASSAAQGTFVFTVPTNQRSDVRIEVDYSVGVTPLVFEGAVAQ